MTAYCPIQGGPCTGDERCCSERECDSCGRIYTSERAARACAEEDERRD